MQPDDLVSVVQDRAGWSWTADGTVATYRADPDWGWSATVRKPAIPPRASQRWHVGGLHPDGASAWSSYAGTAGEAVRMAERWVQAGR